MRRSGDRVRSLWRAELVRGHDLERAGDSEAARAAFLRALAMAPDEAEPAWALGRQAQRRGDTDEAERLFRQALAARPAWPLALVPLCRLVLERPRPTAAAALAEARALLAPGVAAHPTHPLLLAVQSELLLAEGKNEEARTLLLEAKGRGATDPALDLVLARVENAIGIELAAGGESDAAAFAFKRASDLDRRWAAPHANLGALWQRLGKRSRAEAEYARALALDPDHGLAHFNLGVCLRERGCLDRAERAFAAALDAHPPHADARVELGITLSQKGEHARAIALFEEELLRGDKLSPRAYTNLGVACVKAGLLPRAEEAFQKALALDEGYVPALRNLVHLYAEAGRLVEAAALYSRVQRNSDEPPLSN